ncbi:MAG: hypothetical protein EOM20_08990 [Spartobacteria bacterium]|nr:hypothetical protein [Spartobacteria bacterium]
MTLTVPHYGRWFYQREIQMITGIAYTPVRAALIDLEAFGLLKKRTHGNRQYYMVNKDFLMYEEYRSIVLKTTGLGDHLRWRDRGTQKKIATAFVYGAFISGDETTETPIQLCCVDTMDNVLFDDAIATAVKHTEKEFDCLRMTPDHFKQRVADRDETILSIINAPKVHLVGNKKNLAALL